MFARRLKNRNPVSLGKNYHRFHPQGIEAKRLALEEKRKKKEAKDEKAALEELSSTSADDSDDEQPKRGAGAGGGGAPPGSGSGGGEGAAAAVKAVVKRRREGGEGSSSSGSESDDSAGTSSNGSTDDESSGPSSPSLSSSTVDAPIQSWEKPDNRDVAHFRRCRHVCGCKSLTSDGREFVNSQAVMVRGSRRNHEVNQNLHPQCRQVHKDCERLLGPLKERKEKKRRKTATGADGEDADDDDDLDDDDEQQLLGGGLEAKMRRVGRGQNGLHNGGHKEAGAGHSPVKREREDGHHAQHGAPPSVFPGFDPLSLAALSPASSDAWSVLQHQVLAASTNLESMQQLIRSLQNKQGTTQTSTAPPQPPSAPSPTTMSDLTNRYEQLLERTTQQEEELQRLRDTVRQLEDQLRSAGQTTTPQPAAQPTTPPPAAASTTTTSIKTEHDSESQPGA